MRSSRVFASDDRSSREPSIQGESNSSRLTTTRENMLDAKQEELGLIQRKDKLFAGDEPEKIADGKQHLDDVEEAIGFGGNSCAITTGGDADIGVTEEENIARVSELIGDVDSTTSRVVTAREKGDFMFTKSNRTGGVASRYQVVREDDLGAVLNTTIQREDDDDKAVVEQF